MGTKNIAIQNRIIGPGHPVFVIAEAGVNHNGDLEIAKRLIYEAKACGADCVKFQTFRADRIVSKTSPKAAYQLKTTSSEESQFDMLRKLELPDQAQKELIQICERAGVIFLSTPCNIEDVDFLEASNVPAFKVASAYAVESQFLSYIARKGKPILLSTGMCTFAEVDEAVRTIRDAGNDQIVVLQCTTNYPSALKDANLRVMHTISTAFDVLVGYSDHTQGLVAATVAAGLGACVIEKHFTLDKTLPGPDHSSSSDPDEFAQLVQQIRDTEKCLGTPLKIPSESETQNAKVMRRSIVAIKHIKKGDVFTLDNITLKRPGTGFSGKLLNLVLGRRAAQEVAPDTLIDFGMIL